LDDPEAAPHEPKVVDARVETFATDEHRIGLKPILRALWAPRGQRPLAPGHHRYEGLYVTAFVSPATGETHWYVTDGVSKPMFPEILDAFAQEAGAGKDRIVVLVLDNAGRSATPGFGIPEGIRRVPYLPTAPKSNPPNVCGNWSTSPPSTSISTQSTNFNPRSKPRGAHLANDPNTTKSATAFHGRPKK